MLNAESQTAHWLPYALMEMTVIPIPHRQKHPNYRWKRLQWTKLHTLLDTDTGANTLRAFYELGGGGLAVVCGRPSENLFVIDCDTHEALHHTRNQLRAQGINPPTVISSRGGHLYLRCREGALKGVAPGILNKIEIKGDGELAVLPPTIHPSGHIYRWDGTAPRHIPTVSLEDLAFLDCPLSVTANSQRRHHDDTHDYRANGHKLPTGTRNDRLFDASRDYQYVGKPLPVAIHDLLPIAIASGLSEREASKTIASAYKGDTRTPAPRTNTITAQLHAFVDNVQWLGRTGNTDQRLMTALILRRGQDTYNRHNGEFRASYRELMELTHIKSWRTVQNSIQRLTERGYIEQAGKDKSSGASIYRFTDTIIGAGAYFMLSAVHKVHTNTAVLLRSSYCGDNAHPLHKALPQTSIDILSYLAIHPSADTRTLAQAVNKDRTTITRHTAKLLSLNLLTRTNNTYTAHPITPADIARVMRVTGTLTTDEDLARKHDQDRAYFALNSIIKYLYIANRDPLLHIIYSQYAPKAKKEAQS